MYEIILASLKANAPAAAEKALRLVGVKLLGKLLEWPEAWLDSKIQITRDKTEARSIISRAVASQAAEVASADDNFMEAAVEAMLLDYHGKYKNRALVFKGALDQIVDADDTSQSNAKVPNDDWLNTFTRYAEDASSERMQETFARILAGEILYQGSFSRTAMRVMYEMTPEIAEAFETVWQANIDGFVSAEGNSSALQHAIHISKEAALLHSETGYFDSVKDLSNDQYITHLVKIGNGPVLEVEYRQSKSDFIIDISPIVMIENVTKVGKEIGAILTKPDVEANLRNIAASLKNTGDLHAAYLVSENGSREMLPIPLAK